MVWTKWYTDKMVLDKTVRTKWTILSVPFCPIPFCPYTILSIPFCPYHFVRYHFVLEPSIVISRYINMVMHIHMYTCTMVYIYKPLLQMPFRAARNATGIDPIRGKSQILNLQEKQDNIFK